MENQDLSPSHSDASRPSLGFPLGTALLLIIIFSLSGIFSCCYHWDKLRSLRRSFSDDPDPDTHNSHTDIEQPPTKSKPTTHMVIFIFFSVKLISFFLCLILISFTYIFFGILWFEAKSNAKFASVNAWRWNAQVYRNALSLWASESCWQDWG